MRMRAFLSLTVGFLFVSCTTDRFERYHITADELPRPGSGVRITYLGTSGFLLESRDATVLVDPYFTRIGFVDYFTKPALPNEARINWAFERLPQTPWREAGRDPTFAECLPHPERVAVRSWTSPSLCPSGFVRSTAVGRKPKDSSSDCKTSGHSIGVSAEFSPGI
jgi:hypothetical protein